MSYLAECWRLICFICLPPMVNLQLQPFSPNLFIYANMFLLQVLCWIFSMNVVGSSCCLKSKFKHLSQLIPWSVYHQINQRQPVSACFTLGVTVSAYFLYSFKMDHNPPLPFPKLCILLLSFAVDPLTWSRAVDKIDFTVCLKSVLRNSYQEKKTSR